MQFFFRVYFQHLLPACFHPHNHHNSIEWSHFMVFTVFLWICWGKWVIGVLLLTHTNVPIFFPLPSNNMQYTLHALTVDNDMETNGSENKLNIKIIFEKSILGFFHRIKMTKLCHTIFIVWLITLHRRIVVITWKVFYGTCSTLNKTEGISNLNW